MAKPLSPLYNFKVKLSFRDETTASFPPDSIGTLTIYDFREVALPFLLEGAAIVRSVPVKIDITATLVEEKL